MRIRRGTTTADPWAASEVADSGIEYRTVQEVLTALTQKPNATIEVWQGWTVVKEIESESSFV